MIKNRDAGPDDEERLDRALAILRRHASVEVQATANPGELDGVLTRAGSRPVVVAGGDGSLHAVIAALHRRHDLKRSVLGLLPLGTGNDFARGNNIPLDAEEAATALLRAKPQAMDLVVDEVGEVVVNSVHVGAGAEASRHGAWWKDKLHGVGAGRVNLGKLGYPLGALTAALHPPAIRLRVEVDGEVLCDLDQRVLMVAVGNGSSVGGGTELTPGADATDGRLDVMVSLAVGPLARVGYVARLARGSHREHADVRYRRGQTVSVSGEEFWCSADGEVYGPERTRTWHIEPAAYSLLL